MTPGIDERAFIEFEAHGHGAPFEPLSSGTGPLIDGLWFVLKHHELPCMGADGLSADRVLNLSPIDANEGGKRFFR